jgi:putative glutamine amidotransferase
VTSATEPVVAVLAFALPRGRVKGWNGGAAAVPERYLAPLRQAGAVPAILPQWPGIRPAEVIERFDGLLLLGGGDVDPARYGAKRHRRAYGVDPQRDELEIGLVLAADRAGFPTLAVCRGIQVVNVAFGGTLHQHLPAMGGAVEHAPAPRTEMFVKHKVEVAEESRLAAATGRSVLSCSSHHHQGIDRVADGLVPAAWSEDGLVEAVERPSGWLVAVQWHPEDSAADEPAQQALFDSLARLAAGATP